MTTNKARAIAGLRIMLGAGFLYAGLEKVLQLAGTGAFNAAGFLRDATGGAALALAIVGAGEYYGLDALIEKTSWVEHTPALRYVLG